MLCLGHRYKLILVGTFDTCMCFEDLFFIFMEQNQGMFFKVHFCNPEIINANMIEKTHYNVTSSYISKTSLEAMRQEIVHSQ